MHKRYLATKTKAGNYYVCDIIDSDYMELSLSEYNTARNFLGILEMSDPETSGLSITYGDIFCKGSNINVDISYYASFDLPYYDIFMNDSHNVNIYNLTDMQGTVFLENGVHITNSNNINIYVPYSNVSLELFNVKGIKLIGMHGEYGDVETISIAVRTSEQEEVILKDIKRIGTLDLVILDYSQYQNVDFCFFQSEEKLLVNCLSIGVITKALYNHLINTIDNTPELFIQGNTLVVYVFDGERTEIDLTYFTESAEAEYGYTLKCISKGISAEPAQVIIKVDSINETPYKIECQGEGDMSVTVVDKKGNNIVKEYKKG